MKVKLPKDLSGMKFEKAFIIEMNDFDVDLFLPALFYTILSQGRGRVRGPKVSGDFNDPKDIRGCVVRLSKHPALVGFDDTVGRKVLERLIRTTLITTGGVGRAGKGEQITSIVPYTLLSHKAGLPTEGSRLRGADIFLYHALRENVNKADDRLREAIVEIFGRGVTIDPLPELGGRYNGKESLDTLTRLSIAFLDDFQNIRPGLPRERNVTPACPALANELATDLLRFLFAYYQRMPTQAFTSHLQALINFELFNYTLKLVYAINALVQNPHSLPLALQDTLVSSPPQLYLDFTNDAKSYSQEMAKACVRRDVESCQQYLSSIVRLRLLDHYAEQLGRNIQRRARINAVLNGATSGPSYLQGLLLLQFEPALAMQIEAQARMDETRIQDMNTLPHEEGQPEEDEEDFAWLDEIAGTADTDLERVVNLLVEGQKTNAIKNIISWYYGVGGLKKPHGVLRGTPSSRHSWRYAPSNDLLAVLVQVVAARLAPQGQDLQPLRLQEFLRFLEKHYGILIDRPPDTFKGAEYAAAARDNLRAMLIRLRQMGIFSDLSDDFTVQRLLPPYVNRNTARTEMR
jgi:hypothetical protein